MIFKNYISANYWVAVREDYMGSVKDAITDSKERPFKAACYILGEQIWINYNNLFSALAESLMFLVPKYTVFILA